MTPCFLDVPLFRVSRPTQEPYLYLGLPSSEYQACPPSALIQKGLLGRTRLERFQDINQEGIPKSMLCPCCAPSTLSCPTLATGMFSSYLQGPSLCMPTLLFLPLFSLSFLSSPSTPKWLLQGPGAAHILQITVPLNSGKWHFHRVRESENLKGSD